MVQVVLRIRSAESIYNILGTIHSSTLPFYVFVYSLLHTNMYIQLHSADALKKNIPYRVSLWKKKRKKNKNKEQKNCLLFKVRKPYMGK